MTKIFKVNIESLEKRLEDAASVIAHNIVEQIKKTTYANSAGYYQINLYFWCEVLEANQRALIAALRNEIEQCGIELMKRKAAEWEQQELGEEK